MTDKDEKIQRINKSQEEDALLWNKVVEDIIPLKGKQNDGFSVDRSVSEVVRKSRKKLRKREETSTDVPVKASPARLDSGRHEVDRRTLDRLKRGKITIEARLDLHGMSQIQAHEALERFILRMYAQGRRCVLVITGKGVPRSSDAQKTGVLKQRVPEWLREPALHDVVLKVHPARPKDGGEGALYVFLRRKRS